MIGIICISLIIILVIAGYLGRKWRERNYKLPPTTKHYLQENVDFYKKLDDAGKAQFEARVKDFLATTTIRGVDVAIDDLDRTLVAAGAIIPIFNFPDWKYNNISEVLLYDNAFDKKFNTQGGGRDILGMVGDGAMHREMVLSRPSLLQSFKNPVDGRNTVIHEFAHLIDKADGEADGIPEYLLPEQWIQPWKERMEETIAGMKRKNTDINPYGATNNAEFFAVICEYFFERPDKLEKEHPELYEMMEMMFNPKAEHPDL